MVFTLQFKNSDIEKMKLKVLVNLDEIGKLQSI